MTRGPARGRASTGAGQSRMIVRVDAATCGSGCPSDDAVAAWLEHRASASRATELEDHFDSCVRCRLMIAALARAGAATTTEGGPGERERFGRYELRGRLGAGGMGVVDRAYDPQLGREVALKRLRASGAGRDPRERLLREARALARLHHPSIVTIYDVGVAGDEVFFAMELVRGQTLAERLAPGALPWRDVLSLLLPAAEGLAAAHAVGLVHRDFKPANVMLASTHDADMPPRVLVMDFGLARAEHEPIAAAWETTAQVSGERSVALTRTGVVLGTPLYMAPEQHLGLPVDARADQFAFCVVLFEALWGRRPWSARSGAALMASVVAGEIDASRRPRGLPGWLEAAVLRGLSPDAGARHPSMAALVDLLRRGAARRPWRSFVAPACVLGMFALGGWLVQGEDERAPCADLDDAMAAAWNPEIRGALGGPEPAEHARIVAGIDGYVAGWDSLRDDVCARPGDPRVACLSHGQAGLAALIEGLVDADPITFAQAGDAIDALPSLTSCAAPPREQSRDPVLTARREDIRDLHARAVVLDELGRFAAADSTVAEAVARSRALDDPALLADELVLAARIAVDAGTPTRAIELAEEAVQLAESADDVQSRADAAIVLADLALGDTHLAEARRWARHARAAIERGDVARVTRIDLTELEARIAHAEGATEVALAGTEAALAEYERLLGPAHRKVIATRVATARLYRLLAQPDRALEVYERAAAIAEAHWGARHPLVATIANNMGIVLAEGGRLDEADRHFARALEIREAALGPTHPQLASALNNLANIRHERGHDDEALPLYQRAIRIWRDSVGPDSAVLADAWHNLAVALDTLGRYEEALVARERALDVARPLYPDDNLAVALHVCGRGEALARLGRTGEARTAFAKCMPTLERELPDHDRNLISARARAAAL